ncbi:FG-GAP-like repeat-containing protein [Psychroserpens sp.]
MKKLYIFIGVSIFLSVTGFSQIVFENQALSLGVLATAGNTDFGNGVSFCDFDNDGWDDITLATDDNKEVKFFKNVNGTFVEQNFELSYLDFRSKSVTWVDFDNDGDNDLFVTSNNSGNRLLENIGNMTFVDITSTSGMITTNMLTNGASWGDFNNDAYLDVFLSSRSLAIPNKLYKNNGDGTFSDVSLISGIDPVPEISFCSAFLDINNDGFQDIYIANEKSDARNKLYKNNGDGTFDDIGMSSGADIMIDAMTVTVDDYNSDGYFDIYVTNGPNGNNLLRNNGDETFTNVAASTGTLFNAISWGAVFFDADNNKDLDLYVSGSSLGAGGYLSAAFYENIGNDIFELNNSCFPEDISRSFSNAIGDINNDGLIDVVVSNINGENIFLWKNLTVNNSNWIKLKLNGTMSNKDAVGTRIEISLNGEKQYRYTHCGEGYLSQSSRLEHFGLDDSTIIDYIKLTWLSGIEEYHYNVAVNQTLNLSEGSGSALNVTNITKEEIYVCPNPVKDVLTIKFRKPMNSIEVFNFLGQRIVTIDSQNTIQNIDMSNLQVGVYLVKVAIGNQTKTIRVLKE